MELLGTPKLLQLVGKCTSVFGCARAVWIACSAAMLISAAGTTLGAEKVRISGPDLLRAQEAFVAKARYEGDSIIVSYEIADGYYLYRDRFTARALGGATLLGPLELPRGISHFDEFFGEVFTFRNSVAVAAEVKSPTDGYLSVEIISQGCADVGICYPPVRTVFSFPRNGGAGTQTPASLSSEFTSSEIAASQATAPDQSRLALGVLLRNSMLTMLALFFVSGLLLSFTPCVLPLVPVVLGIVSRGSKPGSLKAVSLCLTFIAGTAATYSLLGVVAAQTGYLIANYLQNPWVQSGTATLITLFGVSMLGSFKLRMPFASQVAAVASKVAARGGTHPAAFGFGALATAVLSPCVAPPFVGALLFITQTGNVLVGVSALVAMAAGMGVLPLAAAAGAGTMLPRISARAGAGLRRLFGLLMLGMAVWIAPSLLPGQLRLLLYGATALAVFWTLVDMSWHAAMHSPSPARRLTGLAGMLLALFFGGFGIVFAAGALTGGDNELAPLAHLSDEKKPGSEFATITTPAELDLALSGNDKVTMVDFYAEWCVSCKFIETRTYGDSRVAARLAKLNLVRADMTELSTHSKDLLKKFGLYGPPATIFLDTNGRELARLVGYHQPDEFLKVLDSVTARQRTSL